VCASACVYCACVRACIACVCVCVCVFACATGRKHTWLKRHFRNREREHDMLRNSGCVCARMPARAQVCVSVQPRVCACAHVCVAHARARACVSACVPARASVCVRVRACVRAERARARHPPGDVLICRRRAPHHSLRRLVRVEPRPRQQLEEARGEGRACDHAGASMRAANPDRGRCAVRAGPVGRSGSSYGCAYDHVEVAREDHHLVVRLEQEHKLVSERHVEV
jgi:hypothetical protein